MAGLQYNDIATAQAGMNREQIAQQAQNLAPVIQPGQTTSPGPLKLPQPDNNTSLADASVAGAGQTAKTLQDYIAELTPPTTALDTQNSALMDRLSSLYGQNTGRAEATAQAEASAGLPDLKKQMAELNSQILTKNAEYEKLNTNLEGQAIPLGLIVGQQAQARRQQASDINLLQARGLGLQGNIQAAQDAVDRAVNLKYQGIEEEIAAKEKQLQLIQPLLNQQQQKIAQAQERMYADQKEKIAEQKAKTKENINLAFEANVQTKFVNKNGEFFRVSDGKAYSTPKEFFEDAGISSFEEAYQKGLVTDVNKERLANIDFVQKLRAEYGDAGINFNDTVEQATQKLANSNKYLLENKALYDINNQSPKVETFNGSPYVYNPSTGTYEPIAFEGGSNSGAKYIGLNGEPLKLGVGQVDTLAGFDNTQSASSRAMSLIDAGVKTGPVASKTLGLNKLLNQADPKQMELEQILAQIKADFMKALSGAAVSEPEVKRLSAFLPSISDQENVIKSKLSTMQKEMQSKRNIYLETLGGQPNSSFNSAGNASASNQLKGYSTTIPLAQTITLASVVNETYKPGTTPVSYGATSNECGYYARQVVASTGYTYPALGDGLNAKIATIQKYGVPASQANIGAVVVTKENPTYGHVAVILQKTPQGVIVTESNFEQSGKISNGRLIPYSKIIGAINPTKKA